MVEVLTTDAVVDYEDELVAVIRHDARNLPLEDGLVDLIVTSPQWPEPTTDPVGVPV